MPKRKILFINDSLWSGSGVFRSLQQILAHISYDRFDVTLFIIPDGPVEQDMLGQLPSQVDVVIGQDDTHYYRYPDVAANYILAKVAKQFHRKELSGKLQRRTRRLIRRKRERTPAKKYFASERFDVLIANTVPCCAPVARHIDAEKKYVVFHSSRADFFPTETRTAFEEFDGVIAVGKGVRQMLERTYPLSAEKLLSITNYVDAQSILRSADESVPFPDGDIPTICTCGRLSHEKGFDLAVDAAWILKEKGYPFHWYFVGDGSERPRIEKMIGSYSLRERIEITGFLQNPYPYMKNCDIYVQTSYEEAQPLALMEARILGRAIVSTDTVGGESILDGGRYGALTPVDANGIADAVAKMLSDPSYRASFENKYSPQDDLRAKQEFEAAWDRLLSE